MFIYALIYLFILKLRFPPNKSNNIYVSPPEVPVFALLSPREGYHGLVSEDSSEVRLQPLIRAGPNVCAFVIVSHNSRQDTPFEVSR